MPINQAPQRGYQDWGRVENWDTPLLWSQGNPLGNVPITSPVLDVSRQAYIAGQVFTGTNPVTLNFDWYIDQECTERIAQRFMTFSPSIANDAQLRLPNLGPFLIVTILPIGGLNFLTNVFLFATNRTHPLEFIPQTSQLITRLAVALGAGASVDAFPNAYYSGPIQVFMNVPVAGWSVELDWLDSGGTFQFIDRFLPAVGDNRYTSVAVPGAWKTRITNGSGAAGNFSLFITPTTTGAL